MSASGDAATYGVDGRQLADNVKMANALIRVMQWVSTHAYLFPDGFTIWSNEISAWFYGDHSKENLAIAMKAIRRELQTTSRKKYTGNSFEAELQIPDSQFYFTLYTSRTNVCVKVETGEVIEKEVLDYANAPRKTIQEPVIEWVCDPIIDQA